MSESETRTSADVTWRLDEQEAFSFLFHAWNVSKAKAILAKAPRDLQQVRVADVQRFVSRTVPGSNILVAGIRVDWKRVEEDATIDLDVPLLAAHAPKDGVFIIDGWHRIAKAMSKSVELLPAVSLDEAESQLVYTGAYSWTPRRKVRKKSR